MPQNSGSSPIWEGFGEFLRSPFVKTQRNHENSMKFPTRTQFFPSPKLNENTKTQFLDIFLANQSQKTLKKKAWYKTSALHLKVFILGYLIFGQVFDTSIAGVQ